MTSDTSSVAQALLRTTKLHRHLLQKHRDLCSQAQDTPPQTRSTRSSDIVQLISAASILELVFWSLPTACGHGSTSSFAFCTTEQYSVRITVEQPGSDWALCPLSALSFQVPTELRTAPMKGGGCRSKGLYFEQTARNHTLTGHTEILLLYIQ